MKTIKKIFNIIKYLFTKQYDHYHSCRECVFCKRLKNHKTIYMCIKKKVLILNDEISCKGCLYAHRLLTFKDKINRLRNPYIITYPVYF